MVNYRGYFFGFILSEMSYQINYLASAVKNLQINKIPALESAINRISKKINVTGVDDLIQNINQLREEYGILSKDDKLTSFKETYDELLSKYNLVDSSMKVLDATLASVLTDVIAEPYRASLIPGFAEAREYGSSIGALATGISGSGSSVFSIFEDLEKANLMKDYLEKNFIANEDGFCHVCKVDRRGAYAQVID